MYSKSSSCNTALMPVTLSYVVYDKMILLLHLIVVVFLFNKYI